MLAVPLPIRSDLQVVVDTKEKNRWEDLFEK